MRKLITLFLISLLAGCVGADNFRINSIPEQAMLYVNGEYVGLTPCELNREWYHWLGVSFSGGVHLTIDKEGYKTLEKDIPMSDRKARRGAGNYVAGPYSNLGINTFIYLYTFRLEPLSEPLLKK